METVYRISFEHSWGVRSILTTSKGGQRTSLSTRPLSEEKIQSQRLKRPCSNRSSRYHFSIALHPTEFFDTQIIKGVRKACRPTTEELKVKKMNSNATTKLPVCQDILYIIREKLFKGSPWTSHLLDNRMTYMGAMWGFDLGVRISEMTAAESGCADRNIRANEIVFVLSESIEADGESVF